MTPPETPVFTFAGFEDGFVLFLQQNPLAIALVTIACVLLLAWSVVTIAKIVDQRRSRREALARRRRQDAWDRSWVEMQAQEQARKAARIHDAMHRSTNGPERAV